VIRAKKKALAAALGETRGVVLCPTKTNLSGEGHRLAARGRGVNVERGRGKGKVEKKDRKH